MLIFGYLFTHILYSKEVIQIISIMVRRKAEIALTNASKKLVAVAAK